MLLILPAVFICVVVSLSAIAGGSKPSVVHQVQVDIRFIGGTTGGAPTHKHSMPIHGQNYNLFVGARHPPDHDGGIQWTANSPHSTVQFKPFEEKDGEHVVNGFELDQKTSSGLCVITVAENDGMGLAVWEKLCEMAEPKPAGDFCSAITSSHSQGNHPATKQQQPTAIELWVEHDHARQLTARIWSAQSVHAQPKLTGQGAPFRQSLTTTIGEHGQTKIVHLAVTVQL